MINNAILVSILNGVKDEKPLIHHLTNYVTSNDSANIVLALGGAPLMADSMDEIEEIVPKVDCLMINLGTLDNKKAQVYIKACEIAKNNKVPVVLDPVGVGGTKLRQETAARIMDKVSVVKGNVSEICSLAGLKNKQRGVDVNPSDKLDLNLLKDMSKSLDVVFAITGKKDIVVYGDNHIMINNGSEYLTQVTGTGCMISSIIGTFCAVSNDYLHSAVLGLLVMGIAGEENHRVRERKGIGSFKVALFDTISNFNEIKLKKGEIVYE